MSAKDRAERAAKSKDERKRRAEIAGMEECLNSPNGRALMSWIITTALEAEGKGAAQLRMFGRDIQLAAMHANWDGVQLMRDEWERPGFVAPAPDAEGAEDDPSA